MWPPAGATGAAPGGRLASLLDGGFVTSVKTAASELTGRKGMPGRGKRRRGAVPPEVIKTKQLLVEEFQSRTQ